MSGWSLQRYVISFVVATSAGAASAQAQGLFVGGGRSTYDLSGVGATWVAAARYTFPIVGPLYFEGGTTFFHYEPFDRSTNLLFPEVSAVVRARIGAFSPFLAAGAGAGIGLTGTSGTDVTLHGAIGSDLQLAERLAIHAEFRLRTIGPTGGNTVDLIIGPMVRLSRPL
jgi:hypothetical protein